MNQTRSDSKWAVLQSNLKQAVDTFKDAKTENPELKGRERLRTISINDEDISISEFSLAPTKASNQPAKSIIKNGQRRRSVGSAAERDAFMKQYLKETQHLRSNQDHKQSSLGKKQKSIGNFYRNISNLHAGVVPLQEEEEDARRYEPTYRTDPVEKLNKPLIEDSIKNILWTFLDKINVVQTMSSRSSIKSSMESLTFTIKNRMKLLVSKRHKLVVNCTVIENRQQGMIVASECLWDQSNDLCITVKKERQNYIFIVNLFAVYHE